jgi:CheY-like chemotaxis protein
MLARYLDDTEIVCVASLSAAVAEVAHTPAQALVVNDASVPHALQRVTGVVGLPPNLPAIICSVPETSDIAESLGASDYLVKPIAQDRLLATLDGLHLTGKTVLVVDDEPEASRLFMRMLTAGERDYNVLRAGNGAEALRILHRKKKPDVILLDLVMPEMDGFQVLAVCKSDPALQTIPIVVISARDPAGHPIVSSAIAATQGGGLTTLQVMAAIDALRTILAPGARPGGQVQPENPSG